MPRVHTMLVRRWLLAAACVGVSLALCACDASSRGPRNATAGGEDAQPTSAGNQAQAGRTAESVTDGLSQPVNPEFIGRVWVSTTPGSARGSILVFLPDRTLLMDSCFEPYRLTEWGIAGEHIRWIEDSIPIEAEVELPAKDSLRLRIVGQNRVQSYVAASPPYVCPDMPR